MSDAVAPHKYRPEPMLMGDCRICGNVRDAAVHTVEFASGYREGLEAAAVAYRVCAETRHVTLGVKTEAAIRALMEDTP